MKINKLFPLVISILLFVQSCGVIKNAKSEPIFRYINLNYNERIELGDSFEDKEHLIHIIDDSYIVKNVFFVGSVSIEIILDQNKRISRLIFEYDELVEKDTLIKRYLEDLGTPTLKSGIAVWNDGKTKFEILSRIVNNRVITFSKLTDLKNNNYYTQQRL